MTTYYVYGPNQGQAMSLNVAYQCQWLERVGFQTHGLAGRYRDLGCIYHKLPFAVRAGQVLDPSWQAFCWSAFMVTDDAELPNCVQLFGMLEQRIIACRSTIEAGDMLSAERQLSMIRIWLAEADTAVARLSWAIGQFENQLEYLQLYVWNSGPGGMATRIRMSRRKRRMWLRFLEALPPVCGK